MPFKYVLQTSQNKDCSGPRLWVRLCFWGF